MSKLKLNYDFSYCSGELKDSICTNREQCKRYIKHYEVDAQRLWYVSAYDCVDNNMNHFVKLSPSRCYDNLNELLSKNK